MKPFIEIKQAKNGQFTVAYYGKNRKILASTETFKTLASAKKNVVAMKSLFGCDKVCVKVSTLKHDDIIEL